MADQEGIIRHKVSDESSSIFHYTSDAGLYGILASQELWATHYGYLNDTQEIVASRAVLEPATIKATVELLEELQKTGRLKLPAELTIDSVAKEDGLTIIKALYETTLQFSLPFIFSFCAHAAESAAFAHGLLSQWRGYGKDGGYAIEFDTAGVEHNMEEDGKLNTHSGYHLSTAIYADDEANLAELSSEIGQIANVSRAFLENKDTAEAKIQEIYLPFINCATRIKSSGFAEEQEVRLVHIVPSAVPASRKVEKEILFRQRRGESIPYIKLFDAPSLQLPIKRIIVGPHPKAVQRCKTLQLFCERKKLEIEIASSGIPFLPE